MRFLRRSLIVIVIVHGCLIAIQAQGEQTNTAAPSGVISGRVTVMSGELPPNAIVFVSTLGIATPPRTAVVNSDGTFKLEGLDVGLYRVWTSAPGFISDSSQPASENRGLYHTGDSVDMRLRKGGVITGTVLGGNNAPVVNVNVRAFRIRDENGKPSEGNTLTRERLTDDRGVYRMYGVAPGTYIVSAGGTSRMAMTMRGGAYDADTPTYAPSSTRDTAGEISVRAGEEVTADIQYRGEPGHAISGSIGGVVTESGTLIYGGGTVTLIDVKSRTMVTETSALTTNNYSFAFYGIPDGEYELSAQQYSPNSREVRGSEPKRIKVQGADITGINLTMTAMPAITGRVILDRNAPADCVKRRESAMRETFIGVRRQKPATKTGDAKSAPSGDLIPMQFTEQSAEGVPDDKGDFTLRNLHAGTYRLTLQPPSADWYLRSVALGANVRTSDPMLISQGITLKSQTVSGLTVIMSEGAAGIRGRMVAGENQQLPSRMMIYLVPAEKENASDLLRFFEARVASDGRFSVSNIPPGDYFIVPLASEEDRPAGYLIREDSALRSRVMRGAETANQKTAFKPCQRVEEYELPYSPATKP